MAKLPRTPQRRLNIRIIHPQDGRPIRELTLDPTRDHQPIGGA
jgi:hypothetical protein